MKKELDKKVNDACAVIEKTVDSFTNPVICISFGKDSVFMTHLIRNVLGHDEIPFVHVRVPHYPWKHEWGNHLISKWKMNVMHIPAYQSAMIDKNGKAEIVWRVKMKQGDIVVLIGKLPIEGASSYLCGKDDLLNYPKGIVDWRWDVAFHGHKASDNDNVLGEIPIESDIYFPNQEDCAISYPIKNFTDEDILEASLEMNVPINKAGLEDSLFDHNFFSVLHKMH